LTHRKYRKTGLDKQVAQTLQSILHELMTENQPWLAPGLNLADLSEMLEVTPHTLSQLLNEFIGMNFYDYINGFRLNFFLDLAGKPESRQFTLLSLAYECGFNSKTTFNSFFKRRLGKTPSEYFRDERLLH
jgi:AraC-like DNA-binding protein